MPLHKETESVEQEYVTGRGDVPAVINKTGLWRFATPVRREKAAPCTAACPLHCRIPTWVGELAKGDLQGAWRLLSPSNPFPAVTGHVCYHFCENNCNRGEHDVAIAVRELEKAVGAWRHKTAAGFALPAYGRHTAAVVGAGPSGLACAYYLAQLGIRTTVFEREEVPGGLLAWGIPARRLPRRILAEEIALLKAMGITILTGTEVRSEQYAALLQDFDALFVATGAGREKKLHIPGENLDGVEGAVSFLKALQLGKTVPPRGMVVVAGGGNTAMDAAVAAGRGGAEVIVVYRRTRREMPAHPEEVTAAEEAGVKILEQVQVLEAVGTDSVQGVRLRRGGEKNGQPPAEFYLECAKLLVAVGQEPGCPQAPQPGLFYGGDFLTGPSTVPAAMAEGRRGARAIAFYLGYPAEKVDTVVQPPEKRELMPLPYHALHTAAFPKAGRKNVHEEEAARCFSCGYCNGCGFCWYFCPDLAMVPAGDNFTVLTDYCKGCGICAEECPGRILEMEVSADGQPAYDGK
ncbi:MAG TPA: FAD-dependent oxidoreductase [Firmicutes bacterium]|nr:FAD-dependent oxidoreductase [Bacillota bacterium]